MCIRDRSKAAYGVQETYTVHKGDALFPRSDGAKEIAHLKEEDEKRKAAAEAANNAKAEAKKAAAAPAAEESTVDFTHEEEMCIRDRSRTFTTGFTNPKLAIRLTGLFFISRAQTM